MCNNQQCRIFFNAFSFEKSYHFSSGKAAVRGTGKLSSFANLLNALRYDYNYTVQMLSIILDMPDDGNQNRDRDRV